MPLLSNYKFHLLFLITAVLFLGVTSWLIQDRLKANEQGEVGHSLNAVLSTTQQALKSWVNEHKAETRAWANTPEVYRYTKELLATVRSQAALNNTQAQAGLRAWLRPLLEAKGYMGYFIIDRDNINLAASREESVAKKNLLTGQEAFFKSLWSGETAVSLPESSDVHLPDKTGHTHTQLPTMFVGAPIVDDAGKVIAAFTFRHDPAEDFTAILRKGRLGPRGETYAFDRNGRLISESRFDDQLREIGLLAPNKHGMLNIEIRDPGVNLLDGARPEIPGWQLPLTRMAASAIRGESGIDLNGYRDYRGVTVVGAWLWDDELGFGIATEIDKADAFKTLAFTGYAISGFTVVSVLLLVALMMISILDISRRRRAEQLLREERDRAQNYLDTVEAMIIALDKNGDISLVNRKSCELLGYTEDQLLGKNWFTTCLPQSKAEAIFKVFKRIIAGELGAFEYHENPVLTRCGRERLIAWHNSYLRDVEGNITGLLSAGEDITARKQAEGEARERQAELAHVARLNMMGEMATGLAHELNQPLTAIITSAGVASKLNHTGNNDPAMLDEILDAVITQAKRASEIIRHLRMFVKKQPDQKTNCDLNELVRDILGFIHADLHKQGVQLQLELDETLPMVFVDNIQIEQVLLNLVRNALESMGAETNKTPALLVRTYLNSDGMVQCEVTDNGPGMDPDTLGRIFESFVTTKGAKGLGMGLSISRTIIESHTGQLWAESKAGHGASFYFTVPTAQHRTTQTNQNLSLNQTV